MTEREAGDEGPGNAESAARDAGRPHGRASPVEPGRGIECLLERADGIGEEAAHHRRRHELVEQAVEDGIPESFAEEVYDLAGQEQLAPAYAFELVRCRVGVGELQSEDEEPEPPASDPGRPDWVRETPPPGAARRERRLRLSFRRLRGLLEEHESAKQAITAFVREPDVGEYGY